MNVYTIEIAVQDRQKTLNHEAEQHRLMKEAASEKRPMRNVISAGLRQLFTAEPAQVEPKQPVGQVPARNRA